MAVVRMRDVTEQKNVMRALELSQGRYEPATRAVDAGFEYTLTVPLAEVAKGRE